MCYLPYKFVLSTLYFVGIYWVQGNPILPPLSPEVHITEPDKQVKRIMDSVNLLEKTKKQLRSVLISEKGGVAADRLERDYRDLVIPISLFFHAFSQ